VTVTIRLVMIMISSSLLKIYISLPMNHDRNFKFRATSQQWNVTRMFTEAVDRVTVPSSVMILSQQPGRSCAFMQSRAGPLRDLSPTRSQPQQDPDLGRQGLQFQVARAPTVTGTATVTCPSGSLAVWHLSKTHARSHGHD
jgi:hypothetical protein